MKNSFRKIIISILSIMILLVMIVPNFSKANYRSAMDGLITNQSTQWQDNSSASSKVGKVMDTAISITRVVGMCIAVTLLLVVAIKYMSAAPGEKADIKKASFAYVVGAIVLFGAVGILGIISNFAQGNIKRAGT